MKRMQLFSLFLLLVVAATVTSCKTSRVWANKEKERDNREDRIERNTPAPPPAPRYYSSAALVISPSPGFVMNRHADGRYYHRNPQGLLYWKGHDNRFFLDRSYLNKVSYSQRDYDYWQNYSRGR